MDLQSKPPGGRSLGRLIRWLGDEHGNTAPLLALLLVPIIGALSLGVEASSWFFTARAAQNAADSAAVAAANNGAVYGGTSTEFQAEGRANARKYGFVDGSDNTTVTVALATAGDTCPDGSTTSCYKATVTKVVPIYLTRIVGFRGDTTIGTQRAKTIISVAYAEPLNAVKFPSCMTTTGNDSSGKGLDLKGIPKSSMVGCSISAVGSPSSPVNCNGQGIGGNPPVFSTGTIDAACTTAPRTQNQPPTVYVNPYTGYYKRIPCGINSGDVSPNCTPGTAPTCGTFSGTLSAGSCYTGDITYAKKSPPVTVTGSGSGDVIYVKNGNVNLDNLNLTTTNVTFVFTGSTPGGFIGGSAGKLNITAPGPGATWSGVAAYQDTHLVTDPSYVAKDAAGKIPAWSDNGNDPTIDVVGLMYLPLTDVNFGGGAGCTAAGCNSSAPSSCFITVFHSFDANGTGLAMTKSGCSSAGLNDLPTVTILRAALVK